ncbi:GATA transcription factor 16-like [Cornus florida]|uniref:GATA transcription factor 16-like n=1 Tax=Cornus florida TaxID=4283 RepID=UPI00289FBBDD|nr:GATA transcription factor 16-like [Cornus florida]
MVDPSDKGSESEEMSSKTSDRVSSDGSNVKTCADCGTTKTPLWRGGPAGPKSLCNACGIRSRKKRRALLGLNRGAAEEKKSKKSAAKNNHHHHHHHHHRSGNGNNPKLGDTLKGKLWALGKEVVLQRSKVVGKQRRKLGEEEQAAVLLMALSCGSFYA